MILNLLGEMIENCFIGAIPQGFSSTNWIWQAGALAV